MNKIVIFAIYYQSLFVHLLGFRRNSSLLQILEIRTLKDSRAMPQLQLQLQGISIYEEVPFSIQSTIEFLQRNTT